MYDYISVMQVCMIKEGSAREKTEKKDKEETF